MSFAVGGAAWRMARGAGAATGAACARRLAYCAATARAAGRRAGLTGWRVRRLGTAASLRAALYEQKCWTEVSNDLLLLRRRQKSPKIGC